MTCKRPLSLPIVLVLVAGLLACIETATASSTQLGFYPVNNFKPTGILMFYRTRWPLANTEYRLAGMPTYKKIPMKPSENLRFPPLQGWKQAFIPTPATRFRFSSGDGKYVDQSESYFIHEPGAYMVDGIRHYGVLPLNRHGIPNPLTPDPSNIFQPRKARQLDRTTFGTMAHGIQDHLLTDIANAGQRQTKGALGQAAYALPFSPEGPKEEPLDSLMKGDPPVTTE